MIHCPLVAKREMTDKRFPNTTFHCSPLRVYVIKKQLIVHYFRHQPFRDLANVISSRMFSWISIHRYLLRPELLLIHLSLTYLLKTTACWAFQPHLAFEGCVSVSPSCQAHHEFPESREPG